MREAKKEKLQLCTKTTGCNVFPCQMKSARVRQGRFVASGVVGSYSLVLCCRCLLCCSLSKQNNHLMAPPPPGPYSGTSTLALVRSLEQPLTFNSILFYIMCSLPFYCNTPISMDQFSVTLKIRYHWQVARASAFSFGLVYGSIKLKYLKVFQLLSLPL